MATKFLNKVVAGAALGGASLLIAPGVAIADGPHAEGHVYAHPKWAKAGHEVTIIEVCPEPQKHAYVWSRVTGKVDLKPKNDSKGSDNKREWEEKGSGESKSPEKDYHPKDEDKKDESKGEYHPKDEDKKDEYKGEHNPKDEDKKDEYKGEHNPKDEDKKDEYKGEYHPKDEDKKDEYKGHEDGKYVYTATVKIPWDAEPGKYELKGSCGEGELHVTPKGWVDGGDGGATTSPGLAAGGAGLLGAAALGGILLIRRRRTDGFAA